MEEKRAYLFNTERLQYRLWTFEHILLPSLANQDDRNFRHLVFTAAELPEWAKQRLEELRNRFGFEIVFFEMLKVWKDFYPRCL